MSSQFNFSKGLVSGSTHSALSDLLADDHPQYVLVDGSRAIDTLSVSSGAFVTGSVRVTGSVYITGSFYASPRTITGSTANGTSGEICWDDTYIYVCTADNSWKRSELTSNFSKISASCNIGLTTVDSFAMADSCYATWSYYLIKDGAIRSGKIESSFDPTGSVASYNDSGPGDIGSFPTVNISATGSSGTLSFVVSSSVDNVLAYVNGSKF
jgi:hypothetical protein